MYQQIYDKICTGKYSVIDDVYHNHHIIPVHHGGDNKKTNLIKVSLREHIIAHFLLWKIYNNPNDLRSMHMLGAKLSKKQRQIVGTWCRDNNIGFFSTKYDDKRYEWRGRSYKTRKENNLGIYTKDVELKREWTSKAGKIGGLSQVKSKSGIHTEDISKRNKWASLGGKSHDDKKWVNKDEKTTRVSESELEKYLNEGWKLGIFKRKRMD